MKKYFIALTLIVFLSSNQIYAKGLKPISNGNYDIVGYFNNYIFLAQKQNEQGEAQIYLFDTAQNQSISLFVDKFDPILYETGSVFDFNKQLLVYFSTSTNEIVCYNYILNKLQWKLKIINENPIPELKETQTIKAIFYKNNVALAIGNEILLVDNNTGKVIYPRDFSPIDVLLYPSYNILINNKLVSNQLYKILCFDLVTNKLLWSRDVDKSLCAPQYTIFNNIINVNHDLYVQYNDICSSSRGQSSVVVLNFETGEELKRFPSIVASGIWINNNDAYIFPASNKEIMKFNLDDKTSAKLEVNDFFIPLGIYKEHIYYCSNDSVIKRDLDGKLIDQIQLGKITYNNCKMFDGKICFVDGGKLKIIQLIQLESEPAPLLPFNFISWILHFIFGKLTLQP